MAFPTTSILDSGAGADQNPLAGNWQSDITLGDFDNMQRTGNKFATTANTASNAYWAATTFGADSEAYITLDTLSDNTVNAYLFIGLLTPHTAGVDGYEIYHTNSGTLRYFRIDNKVPTQLGADESVSLSAGDSLGFERIGSTLQAYKKTGGVWSVACPSRTDATYSSAGNIGTGADGLATRLTNFGGGTVVSGPGAGADSLGVAASDVVEPVSVTLSIQESG